jgi:hypothetical protein
VCDALRAPGAAVTSLDLSGNRLTDAGAAALAAALGGGAAPDLIALNVAGNPLTETGRAALQSLARVRRGLDVTWLVPDIVPPVGPQPGAGASGGGRPRLPHTGKSPASGMASRFFGGAADGEGAADPRGGAGGGGSPGGGRRGGAPSPLSPPGCLDDDAAGGVSALEAAQAALSAASAAVAGVAAGLPDALRPAALGAALFAAVAAVDDELAADGPPEGGPPRAYPRLAALPPATLTLAQAAEVLVAVLSLAPQPLPWQGGASPGALRPGIGTHRLAALQLLARLAALGCDELDAVLAAQALLPRAVALLFEHECSSAAHSAAARLLQAALGSAVPQLWLPAFAPGPHGDALQARLAAAGTAAVALSPGRRAPHVGAVLAVANGLRAMQRGGGAGGEGGGCAPALLDALEGEPSWGAFCEGPLQALNEQQAGTLCGPKPARPAPLYAQAAPPQAQGGGGGGSAAAAGGGGGAAAGAFGSLMSGGGLMSGRELLAMLQTLGRMSS